MDETLIDIFTSASLSDSSGGVNFETGEIDVTDVDLDDGGIPASTDEVSAAVDGISEEFDPDAPASDSPQALAGGIANGELGDFADYVADSDDANENGVLGAEMEAASTSGGSFFDTVFELTKDVWDRFFQPFFDPDDIVRSSDFSQNGSFDTKNNVVVVGDVASDIGFIGEQTHGSCSLMAQEQFVHRYIGKPIPEEYLEWQAEKWGVYSPDIGTVTEGQDMILDHFDIPHERVFYPDLDDIVESMSKGNDVLIGVDARDFYQDPSIPPGSGHAVALVGRGLDPATGELAGFYVTDSNYPGAAHYLPVEQLAGCWDGADMISVPEIAA